MTKTAPLDELRKKVAQLETRVQDLEEIGPKPFLNSRQAAKLLGVTIRSLTTYRTKYWTQGVHFFRHGKSIRYNSELLLDWQKNRGTPENHDRTIQQWIRSNK